MKKKSEIKKVFVTGGAGYVGARLVPTLLEEGYKVTVLDLMLYGTKVLKKHPNLKIVKGDIRNRNLLNISTFLTHCCPQGIHQKNSCPLKPLSS